MTFHMKGEEMRLHQPIAVAAVAASVVLLSACGSQSSSAGDASGECGPLDDVAKVSVGINPGVQELVVDAIKDQGIDAKHNLDLDVRNFQNPPASATAVTQGAVDVGFGGTPTMAIARDQGNDVFFFGALASPSNGVFVKKGSDIQDIGDLAGKRLGSFSAENSATFAVLSAIATDAYGIENLKDDVAALTVAPDAAALGLLDQGEVDAVLLGSTASVVADLDDRYEKIGDLSREYLDAVGTAPVHVTLTTKESYAEGHCSELVSFFQAMQEGVEFVKGDDDGWADYADKLEFDDPNAVEALRDATAENFQTEWDQDQIDGMTSMLESFVPILGEKNFISEVPDGLFSLDYTEFHE